MILTQRQAEDSSSWLEKHLSFSVAQATTMVSNMVTEANLSWYRQVTPNATHRT